MNNLLRTSYHRRNQRREMLKRAIEAAMRKQLGDDWRSNWQPFNLVRVDAILYLGRFLDHFELPACLKIEMDALQETKPPIIRSDGPHNLERGDIVQRSSGRPRVRIRLTELQRRPQQPELDF